LNKMMSIVSAAILGVTIMVLPILVVAPTYQYHEAETMSSEKLSESLNEEVKAAKAVGESDVGALVFPSSLIYAGFVMILGLVAAFGISYYAKKRLLAPI